MTTDSRAFAAAMDRTPALEHELARFLGVEDALVYIGGHPANVSTISHLFNRDDVILCDVAMPGISGIDLYEAIEKRFPALKQRLVFVTGGAFTARARDFLLRTSLIASLREAEQIQ